MRFFCGYGRGVDSAIFLWLATAEFSAASVADKDGFLIYTRKLVGSLAMWTNDTHGRIMCCPETFVSSSNDMQAWPDILSEGLTMSGRLVTV